MTDRSLAIDSAGQPHLAYGLDYLYYAWYDGAAWHHETLDPAPGVGENAAIALDGDDAPHIAYYDRAGEAIKSAHQDGSGWYTETVVASGWGSGYRGGVGTSIAVDTDDYPHISYFDSNLSEIRYLYKDETGWHSETVNLGGNWGYTSSPWIPIITRM